MCGIAGCYQREDGAQLARAMADALAHRGPDAHGAYDYDADGVRCTLTHRRLSIIDLSEAGTQPFTKDGLVLVYNGELYNYRELRAELAAHGVQFRTATDTEVVLEAWRYWGADALTRFRGMFAFALFDEQTRRLVLARDQLGIKPLFFLRSPADGSLVFASELKAISQTLGDELDVDLATLVASMLYYWVPDQRCAFSNVRKLPPGTWAEFDPNGNERLHTYWSMAEVAQEAAAGPPADLASVIEDSIAAHLVADVPVSTFLSGGLDSSIITVLAKRHNPDIDAYTITFRAEDQLREAMPDDAVYARKVAAQYGVSLHEIEIAPDVTDLLPRIVDVLDEPNGDPAAINTLLICQAARDAGVKVLLSGMGADELFGGYRKHLACVTAARYQRLPKALRKGVVQPIVQRMPVAVGDRGIRTARWAKRFITFADLPEEAAFRRSYTMYDADDFASLLGPDLAPLVDDVFAEHRTVYEQTTLPDHVNRMCFADTQLFLTGLNLAYTDRASMAASTEVRVPFVDIEVARAAFSIPGSEKVAGRAGKVALKRTAEAWLPKEIIYRPKASFGAPLRSWISGDLSEMVDDVLVNGELVRSGMLRKDAVLTLIEEERAGREDRAKQIWQLLSLELWYDHVRAVGARV
jgi:asparagine synthase (glutamine-hydrolysing)